MKKSAFNWLASAFLLVSTTSLFAEAAFKINGKETSVDDAEKKDPAGFYDLEKKRYDKIEEIASQAYLDYFWDLEAKKKKVSSEQAMKEYIDATVKMSDKEVKETLEKFKDHPKLSKLPKEEQEKQVKDYLKERDTHALLDGIIEGAKSKGELVLLLPKPEEPVYKISVRADDHVRYGPKETDTDAKGCQGDACAITIVEYSEYQCPFCSRVMPDIKRVLSDYQGKIRWIVRDFPLSFHDRARPAAIAAKCASFQGPGKYWSMYYQLFSNQKSLGDSDLETYGKNISLDLGKYKECVSKPAKAEELIDKNFQSGVELGVTGTPAFFINGRRLSGALPYADFKKVIDEELSKKKG